MRRVGGIAKRLAIAGAITGSFVPIPALAQEIVIRCSGESNMTIFNPHGNGGTARDSSPRTWTVRTDGQAVSLTTEGTTTSTAEATEVELSSYGLSFCVAAAGVQCGVPQVKVGSATAMMGLITITTSGTFGYDFVVMDQSASMKTGVIWENRGQCDDSGIAGLRRLAEGGAPSPRPDSERAESAEAANDDASVEEQDQAASDEERQRAEEESQRQAEADAEQEERERLAREEEEVRAEAEQRRQEERERRLREEEEQRAEEERIAKEKQAEAQRKKELEDQQRAEERRRKEEEANRLIEFKEGVVLCEPRGGSSKESRCHGPLQMTIVQVKTLDDPATRSNIGMACGSDRDLRDLGMVNSMRAFGCGFGIHPNPNMADYPGNRDIPARFAVYIADRAVFRCKKSTSAYCRGR